MFEGSLAENTIKCLCFAWGGHSPPPSSEPPPGGPGTILHVAPPPSREPQAFRELLAACAGTDAGLATRRLLDWARLAWPDNPPASLATLRDHTRDPGLAAAIETLIASRYAAQGSAWRGESLGEAVEALRRRRAGGAGDPDGGLAPLYPRGRAISG